MKRGAGGAIQTAAAHEPRSLSRGRGPSTATLQWREQEKRCAGREPVLCSVLAARHPRRRDLSYETIRYEEDGPIGTITPQPARRRQHVHASSCAMRCATASTTSAAKRARGCMVLTGAGDKFFCIGGRKEGMEDTTLYAGTLPTLEMYEAIERSCRSR